MTVLIKSKGNSFTVVLKLRPTPISKEYDIQISFDHDLGVKVNVVNEKLKVAKSRSRLPHVYSHNEQRLCLYSPRKIEWTRERLISSSIIPWASDWLFYYEHWLIDGEWLGGGHNEYSQIDEEIDEREKV